MQKSESPSGLTSHLGYWLRMISNAVSVRFARKLESEGVTVAEWVFLRVLYDVDEIAPSLLAERMGMTKGAISKLGERLIDKNLVLRRANRDDGRAHVLSLTAKGRKIVPKLAAFADENEAVFFGSLAPGEREQLETLLRKIAADRGLRDIPVD